MAKPKSVPVCLWSATGDMSCPATQPRRGELVEGFEDQRSVLRNDESLLPGQQLTNRTCGKTVTLTLTYQGDGNLVMLANREWIWHSGTWGKDGGKAVMQSDGNFVLYDASGNAYWSTSTAGKGRAGGYTFTLAANGNLVLRDYAGETLWTQELFQRVLEQESVLRMDYTIPPDGQLRTLTPYWMRLHYQMDGNLVLYATPTPAMGERAVWATNTVGSSTGLIKLQRDGNLVMADAQDRAPWHSGSMGKGQPPYILKLQQDGNLVLADGRNQAIWATGTNVLVKHLAEWGSDGVLAMHQTLPAGQDLRAASGPHWPRLAYDPDGNLRLYARPGGAQAERLLWESRTAGGRGGRLHLQGDGNLVLYNDQGYAYWATGTNDRGELPATLVVQPDASVVLYDNKRNAMWSTGTNTVASKLAELKETVLPMHSSLRPGEEIRTSGEHWIRLAYETNGNLRIYGRPGNAPQERVLWETATYDRPAGHMLLQGDGNLVLLDATGKAYWTAGSQDKGRVPYSLAVQMDGNLVVYDGDLKPLWASNTESVVRNLLKFAKDANGVILPMHQELPADGEMATGWPHWIRLKYYTDGNLVLYARPHNTADEKKIWETGTGGRSAGKALMQGDGNFVLFDSSGRSYWATGSGGRGRIPYTFAVQGDGNMVVIDGDGQAMWAANTNTMLDR